MSNVTTVKTVGTSLLAWSTIATANVSISSELDCGTKLAASIYVWIGRASGTAFTAGYPKIRIEQSAKSSGNDAWIHLQELVPTVGANLVNTTLNGAVSAGATSCVVTSATNIAAGDLLFLGHTTTASNYEFVWVKSVSGTTVTFEEACTNAHDSGAQVTDQAEHFETPIDCQYVDRVRVVVVNHSGQSIVSQILAVTTDSLLVA